MKSIFSFFVICVIGTYAVAADSTNNAKLKNGSVSLFVGTGTGFTYGVGVTGYFSSKLSISLEYNHLSYDSRSTPEFYGGGLDINPFGGPKDYFNTGIISMGYAHQPNQNTRLIAQAGLAVMKYSEAVFIENYQRGSFFGSYTHDVEWESWLEKGLTAGAGIEFCLYDYAGIAISGNANLNEERTLFAIRVGIIGGFLR